MAQTIGRLSAIKVTRIKDPGYYADGGNLYFRVAPSGARGWMFRFTMAGRTRDMGLGSYPEISLATARELADKFRPLVKAGIDPIERRRDDRAAQRIASAKNLSFDECARAYIEDHEAAWRNAKHRAQWSSTLKQFASPMIGKLPVSAIDAGLVIRVLKPIWHTKTETASRLRGRIESILDWARVHGYRSGENPARWKGNLDHLLPSRAKVRPVKHHVALPYTELAAFMADLRARRDGAARALEFTILTAARTNETLGATREETNVPDKAWTVPARRMKARREHRVPLSKRTLALLEAASTHATGDFLFEGQKAGRPLSNMAMLRVLERMGRTDLTVHGFRSTFRDWAAECTSFPGEVVEMALAHIVENKTEAAYRRGDLFEKRRRLMDAWADYCAKPSSGEVVPLRGRNARKR